MSDYWFNEMVKRALSAPLRPMSAEDVAIAQKMPADTRRVAKPSAPPAPHEMRALQPPPPLMPLLEAIPAATAAGVKRYAGGAARMLGDIAELEGVSDWGSSQIAEAGLKAREAHAGDPQRGFLAKGLVGAFENLPSQIPSYAGGVFGGPLGYALGNLAAAPSIYAGTTGDTPTRLMSTAVQSGIEAVDPTAMILGRTGMSALPRALAAYLGNTTAETLQEPAQLLAGESIEQGIPMSRNAWQRGSEEFMGALPTTTVMGLLPGLAGVVPQQPKVPRETPPPRFTPEGQAELPLRIGFGRGENATLNHMVKTTLKVLDSNDWAGATVNARRGDMTGKRAVATSVLPEAERIIPGRATQQQIKAYARENWPLLRHEQMDLGTWMENGNTYLDVVATPDNFEAAQNIARTLKAEGRGKPEGEIAGYNLETGETLPYTYPPEQPAPVDLELFGQPPMGPMVFNQQTPNWQPWSRPGTGGGGLVSTQPGGHHVTISPDRGQWVVENYGSKWAKAPTLEEARAKAEQMIANLPTVSDKRTAEAQAAQALHPADADLGVLEGEAALRNMGPAASVTMPRPQPQRPQAAPMSPEEQRMADMLKQASGVAQKFVNMSPEGRAAQQQYAAAVESEMPQDVAATLTGMQVEKADLPFPVWDFIKNRVALPYSKPGADRSAAINELLEIAVNSSTLSQSQLVDLTNNQAPKALEPQTAIRWLKGTDPDYLNMILSRAVSGYYGDRGAAAMLQMEEATADARTKALLEDINLAIEKSPHILFPGNAENAIDAGQQTVAPLGEVPPMTRYPSAEQIALENDDKYDALIEEQRAEQTQQRFPEEVMNTLQDAFIREALDKGGKTSGMWRIYTLDGKPLVGEGLYTDEKSASERLERINAQREFGPVKAFVAPVYAYPGGINNKLNAFGDYQYQERGTGWRIGNRQITDDAVREFFAAAGRRGHKDRGYFDTPDRRTWRKGYMEVRANQGWIEMRLHGNLIARYDRSNGDLELRDAGWQTRTTKERLNGLLEAIDYPDRIYQRKFRWYIGNAEHEAVWDGSILIPGVTRRDTGTFAMQGPTGERNVRTTQPLPGEFNPQATLPGIPGETRAVTLSKDSQGGLRFTLGDSSIQADVVRAPFSGRHPDGTPITDVRVLDLTPHIAKGERRADALQLLLDRVLDYSSANGLHGISVSFKFAQNHAGALMYAQNARGLADVNGPGVVYFMDQFSGVDTDYLQTYGAMPEYDAPNALPPMDTVSDEFFRQVAPKFVMQGHTDKADAFERFGAPHTPMTPDERRLTMSALEGLEKMGVPPFLTNRLQGIARGAYDSPGNLAQVTIGPDTLSISANGLRGFANGNHTGFISSLVHELGHMASIMPASNGMNTSPIFESPLFKVGPVGVEVDANGMTTMTQLENLGPVLREVMEIGARGMQRVPDGYQRAPNATLLEKIFAYPVGNVLAGDPSMDAERAQAEAFAQVWATYYVFPQQLKDEMPHAYNLMHELDNYGRNVKDLKAWTPVLKAALRVKGTTATRKKALAPVLSPFQKGLTLLHQDPAAPVAPAGTTYATGELEQKAGTAVAGDSTALTPWATALAETTKQDWELAKGGVIPHAATKNSAVELAARVGFSASEVGEMLTTGTGSPGEAARGIAMAATTSRVNLARAVMAPDIETFAARLADAANMLVVARTQASEAGRALGHWGWMIREGKDAAETSRVAESAADEARKFLTGKETFGGADIIEKLGGIDAAEALRARLYESQKAGTLDIDNIARAFNAQIAAGLRAAKSGKLKSLADMPLEWFKVSILTGPATHEVNLTSTALNIAIHNGLVEPLARAVNLITGAPDQPSRANDRAARKLMGVFTTLGDVGALAKFGGSYEYPAAQIGQLSEANPYQQQAMLALGEDKWRAEREGAIPGAPGRVARTSTYGALGFEDAALKAIVLRKEIAMQMDMRGTPWDGVSAVPADVMADAMVKADKLTFNADPGRLATHLNSFVRGTYIGKWVVLFTRTMSNIIRTGVSYTPGANLLLSEEREALASPHTRAQNEAIARMAIGTGLFALVALLRNDEDDPDKYLTATAPKNWAQRNIWYLENGNLAIRLPNGKQVEIYRMEPLNIILGSMIGAVDAMKREDLSAPAKLAMAAKAMGSAVLNSHFLRSVADIVESFTRSKADEDPLQNKGLQSWLARTGAAMTVPQIGLQAAQFMDTVQRRPDPTSYVEQVKARIPGLRETLPPGLNVRGETIPEARSRAFFPAIPVRPPGKNDPLAKQMLRWEKGMGFPKGIEKLPTNQQQAILAHRWHTLQSWGPYKDEEEFARALSSYTGRKEVKALRAGDFSRFEDELEKPKFMQGE